MHIGYVFIPYQPFTGVGEYQRNLIKEILEIDAVNNYSIFLPHGVDAAWAGTHKNAVWINTPIRSKPVGVRYFQMMCGDFLNNYNPKIDLLHCFNFPLPPFSRGKIVLTVHDFREEDLPEFDGNLRRMIMRYIKPRSMKRAAHIITVSEFSKKRLDFHYPFSRNKSTRIYLATSHQEKIPLSEIPPSPYPRPYLFAIGQLAPHKNLDNLIRAYNYLLERGCDYDLIIAGRSLSSFRFAGNLHTLSKDKNRVKFTGMISDQEKFIYLKNAKLFIYPSLYEGFGIPLLEAFSLQTPLAVSRIPVFEEIFGLTEAMFDPRDPSDIARVIETICNDPLLREAIIAHGKKRLSQFSWKKTAQETLFIYNNTINF